MSREEPNYVSALKMHTHTRGLALRLYTEAPAVTFRGRSWSAQRKTGCRARYQVELMQHTRKEVNTCRYPERRWYLSGRLLVAAVRAALCFPVEFYRPPLTMCHCMYCCYGSSVVQISVAKIKRVKRYSCASTVQQFSIHVGVISSLQCSTATDHTLSPSAEARE